MQRLSSSLRSLLVLLATLLVGTAIAASNVVQYTYDAAGNLVQVQRQAAPGFAITSFSPTSGPVGTTVTIYGTGFSATPANNAVQFNGTAATVAASDAGSISTTVPTGAATGRISVTVNGVTVTSASNFTVTIPGAPTITSFSPTSGIAATSVTVTGSNFDTTAGGTTGKLNGVAGAVSVADPTSLAFTVPNAAGSGTISVTTAGGTATTISDFIVPPPGMAAADIAASLRIAPGAGNGNISLASPGKSGIVLFDAQPNVYYSIQLAVVAVSPTSATVAYQLIKPDNTVLQSGAVTGGSNRPTIHLPLLPSAGTYALVLSPGTATLNTNVRVDIDPSTSVDGSAIASSLDYAYQSARFSFAATAGQHVGVGIAGVNFTPASAVSPSFTITIIAPDGTQVSGGGATCYGPGSGNPQGNCDSEFLAPSSGTFQLIADSSTTSFGNATVQFSSETTGALSADLAQTVNLARVGQDARFTFAANAGDSLALDLYGATLLPQSQTVRMDISKADGTLLKSCSAAPPHGLYCDLFTLAAAGTYTVYLDPTFGAYGTLSLNLKQGPLLVTTDPATAFAPAGVTEAARFRFSGTAGQNLSLGVSSLGYVGTGTTTTLSVSAPNGTAVGVIGSCNPASAGGNCRAVLANVPQTGTYSVTLQPPDGVKITGNIGLNADITGTIAPGTPQTFSSRPGQLARLTFAGNAGDSTSVKLIGVTTNVSSTNLSFSVNKPDGTVLASATVGGTQTEGLLNFASLPVSGTYTVVIDPSAGQTWQATVELDPGTSISVDGPTVAPATSVAGEPLRYTFAASVGQRIDFGLSGLTYGATSSSATSIAVFGPTGTSVLSTNCVTAGLGSCDAVIASAPATGTYSMLVTPPQTSSITGGAFALSTPLAGSFVVGNPAQTIGVSRPGQTARYTFAGSSGQLLRLNWSGTIVQGSSYVAASVLKPDGTTLSSSTFVNGANGGLSIASLPTTGTYTVFLDPSVAATFSGAFSLVTQ